MRIGGAETSEATLRVGRSFLTLCAVGSHDLFVLRTFTAAFLAVALCAGAFAQELAVLHVKVSVLEPGRGLLPAVGHALLVSDNPPTSVPRRVVTSSEGTAELRLRPGNYTIESERPFILNGRSYEWTKTIDIVVGRDATLELTADNAAVRAVPADLARADEAAREPPAARTPSIPSALQESAFAIWTPYAHATGFLADERGLVATSLRAIGTAKTVEVQISGTVKVTGAVVVADASQDVAIIRVNASAATAVRAAALACDVPGNAALLSEPYAIEVPLRGAKKVVSDLVVSAGGAGGPVFTTDGRAIGLTSPMSESGASQRLDVRIVPARDVCDALAAARAQPTAAAPDAAHLPIEPGRTVLVEDGTTPQPTRVFRLDPYQLSSSDFDVALLTPVLLTAARAQSGRTAGRADEQNGLGVATEFANWSDYVAEAPPVLFVRVTPRLVEGFWMKVARGAASTQGAQVPPIKRLRPGFSQMRLICGGKDITPIHPFRIQTRVTETEAVEEGLYVFDPAAIGPHCGTVSIVLSSVKEPDKTETRIIAPGIVNQVWQDFAIYRSASDRR